MDSSNREIKVVPDVKAVADEAANRVVDLAAKAVAERGKFSIALSGGSTPKVLYGLIASEPYRSRIDWARFHVLFGDERCVPADAKDSNYRMADEALLSKVPIPVENVHRMRADLADQKNTPENQRVVEQGAMDYGLMLQDDFPDGLDLVLLGLGTDGHTASIFPNNDVVLKEMKHRVVGYFAPNSSTGESWRITMTAPYINQARAILVLIVGRGKPVAEVLEGPPDPDRLPMQLVNPTQGKITWLMDVAAADMDVTE